MDPAGRTRNADIGYHLAIDLAGRIYEGRAIGVKGAHLSRFNTGIVGIVLLADLDEQLTDDDDHVTDAMRASCLALVADLVSQYPGIRALGGHGEFPHNTDRACPGNLGLQLVTHLRECVSLAAPTLENCASKIPYAAR